MRDPKGSINFWKGVFNMETTHTFHHGLNHINNSHVDGTKKELNKVDIEKRDLYISGVSVGAIISIGMLVAAYFLLW